MENQGDTMRNIGKYNLYSLGMTNIASEHDHSYTVCAAIFAIKKEKHIVVTTFCREYNHSRGTLMILMRNWV